MENAYDAGLDEQLLEADNSVKELLESLAQNERELKAQVRLFSAFLDALPNPIFVKDNNAVFIACNRAYEEAFGIAREAFIGKTVLDLEYLPEASRAAFQRDDLALLRERGETREEIELAFADGQPRPVLYQRRTFELGNGQGGMLGLIVDISQRKWVEDMERFRSRVLEMLAGGAQLGTILQAVVQGVEALCPGVICSVMLADDDGGTLSHRIAPSLPGMHVDGRYDVAISPESRPCGVAAYKGEQVVVEDITGTHCFQHTCQLAASSGLVACWSQPIKSGTGEVLGTLAMHRRYAARPDAPETDLIEQTARLASIAIEKTRAERTIRELAYYDPLTALPNRRMLSQRLEDAFNKVRRGLGHGALMLLDLDNFKPLNDTYGHHVGDLLLVEVARRLVDGIRGVDMVARLGGDEFVLLLEMLDPQPEQASDEALQVAEHVRATLEQPYQLSMNTDEGGSIRINHHCSASVGISLFCGAELSKGQVLRRADEAMYIAKESGRNAIHLYTGSD